MRYVFAEETKDSDTTNELTVDQRASALKESDHELYSAIFGRGSTKGAKEVTDAKVAAMNDEQKKSYFEALRTEKVTRALRKKAEAVGFIDPDDAVDLLGGQLTLNDQLEVVSASDGEIANIDDAVKTLANKRPHLVRASDQRPGQGSAPPAPRTNTSQGDKPTFKRSQLRDAAFYAANEKEILEAARDNRIIDDIKKE
jgi:hypothetical protein